MHLPPLQFKPILKPRTWGGDHFQRPPDFPQTDTPIGESWTLADLPTSIIDGRSVVADGPMAGRSLHELVTSVPDAILGSSAPTSAGGFPLLVKILDAADTDLGAEPTNHGAMAQQLQQEGRYVGSLLSAMPDITFSTPPKH